MEYEETPPCTCGVCKAMCYRPCWPTPKEARALIEMGYAKRLMLDYWVAEPNIYIVGPAVRGYEGERAPFWPTGGCTFQDESGMCEIHNSGAKPFEARMSSHERDNPDPHKYVAGLWDSDEGRKVMELWRKRVK